MAIIYSYPTVTPTTDDLILGTDVNQSDKPTKNFTIASIIDLVTAGATGLGAVLKLNNSAKDPVAPFANQSAIDFLNITGTGTASFPTLISTTITNAGAITTNSLTAAGAVTGATLNGILAAGSSIAGLAGGTAGQNVLGVTQNAGDNSTRLATTAYVDSIVDTSVLTFVGTTGGNQTVNLATETFSILGTANQIESVSSAQTITFNFPAAGVILPDGSAATTQAAADNSTLVATTAFVQQEITAQDLDFTGDTGTGSVDLDSQALAITGTALQITTLAAGQSLAISLPASITIGGTYTGTTFAGDLLGTVNTATTGVTQAAGDDSTLMATTAYVDAAAGAKILQYQGDTGGPFDLNLEDDDLDIAGGSNISTTAATVAANLGVITIDLDDSVTISGTMTADTFETTAGTATWSTTVMGGFTSITSTLFIGALQGNADSATALAATGSIGFGGEVTLSSAAPSAVYTSGGSITFNLDLVNAAVTGQVLTGLPTPAAASITAGDTILSAFGKTQSQINSIANGLQFQGTWNATTNSPALASGGGEATSGTTDGATTTDKLIDSTANFTATVTIGDKVINQVDGQTALVSAIDSATVLSIDTDIMLTGEAYTIDNTPFLTQGHYYVVSVAGSTSLNGISTWVIGDWVIAGATNVWEKLDGTAVQGTGTDNYLTKWNGTGVSIIVDSGVTDDGSTIKLLNDVELGASATDTTIVKGPATFDENTRFDKSISIGAAYGVAGQVFTSGGGSGAINTWTTPLTGTVTSVALTETGDALTITGSPITTAGTLNIAGAGTSSQYINGELDLVTFPTVDNYVSWTADSDEGTDITVTSGFNLKFTGAVTAGGAGISTDSAISADEMTIGLINAGGTAGATTFYRGDGNWAVPPGTGVTGSGTLNTVARWATTGSIGDGPIVFSAATATADSTFGGYVKVESASTNGLIVNSTDAASIRGLDIQHSGVSRAVFDFHPNSGEIRIGGITTSDEYPVIYSDGIASLTFGLGATPSATFVGSGTFAGDVNITQTADVGVLNVANLDSGAAVGLSLTYPTTNVAAGDGLAIAIGIAGRGRSYIANSNVTTNLDASNLVFYTEDGGVIDERMIIDSAGAIQFNDYGSGTHTGTEAYTLGVDSSGNIIETIASGGGGGTAKGGTFSKVYTTGAAGVAGIAFTIDRATTGSMVFDVMLTSDTSTACTIAKKYTVVCVYGATAPIYNKILDTGPDTDTSDFTVAFADDTSNTKIKCTITPVYTGTQKIGITIDLGYGENDATVVMN